MLELCSSNKLVLLKAFCIIAIQRLSIPLFEIRNKPIRHCFNGLVVDAHLLLIGFQK